MNILMVGPHKDKVKGGISTVINDYIESEYLNEFNIYHIATVVPGNILKKVLYGFRSMILMIYYFCFKKIDIVHIHTASGKSFFRKSIFVRISSLFKKYIIIHIHGGGFKDFYYKNSSKLGQKRITRVLNKTNQIIVLSNSWKTIIEKITTTDIKVVSNSVKGNEKNKYDILSKKITFIGRVEDEKGIFDFIEAAKEIVKSEEVYFTICGDGKLAKVKELLRKYDIEDRFEILGWVDKFEIENQLSQSMIFVLPSYKEAMPMAILEAMNYGVPVISTNVGSIPEFIKENKNGMLFEPGNIELLISLMKKMITNSEIRSEISNHNIKDIKEKYDNKVNHNKIKKLYLLVENKEKI